MIRKQLLICLAALFIGVFIFMGSTIRAVAANTLNIGAIWGLSGPGSQVQAVMRDGAILAKDWINSKGGITVGGQKYEIELLVEDNKNTAEGSAGAATKLVYRDKVKFISGLIVPFQIEAVQTVTEPNKVILSTAKCAYLNPKNRYTFTCTLPFSAPIPGLYDVLLKKYPWVKAVGFTAHDEPGALATLKIAREVAKGHGLSLLDTNLTPYGIKEYYPVWTKLLKDKPDAVDIGISFPDCIAANARHGRELGFKGPIITPHDGEAGVMLKMIGEDYATDYICAGLNINDPNNPPIIKFIVELWGEKYRRPFNRAALDGWSSVWGLAQAIEESQGLDSTQVMKTWANMKSIETVSGTGIMGGERTYGINHMVVAPAAVTRLQNGKVDSTHWYKPDIQ